MKTLTIAQLVQEFVDEFKREIVRQVNKLNLSADGDLQDGFSVACIDDGWVKYKGYAWGFVILYEDPIMLDMTYGPDWPFVGHRTQFFAQPTSGGISWVRKDKPHTTFTSPEQLATYSLRRLAGKVHDEDLFHIPIYDAQGEYLGESI
jgi:hypothetical protein